MAAQHGAERRQFVAAVDRAGGVGRAVDDEQPGFRGDRRFQLRRGDLEALLDAGLDDHRLAVGEDDDVGIRHPVGRGNDDFVAGVDHGLRQVEEALLAAARHQNLLGRVVESVVALELGDDRRLQAGGAVDRRVFGEARVDRRDRRILDVLRGVEIGFAGAEADDVAAARLERGGAGGDGQGGGGLDGLYAAGEFHSGSFMHPRWRSATIDKF